METKGPGRPSVGDKAKDVFFAARFNPLEAKTLLSAIKASGESKSSWIRKTLLSAASNDKR